MPLEIDFSASVISSTGANLTLANRGNRTTDFVVLDSLSGVVLDGAAPGA